LDEYYRKVTLVACSEAARKNLARVAKVDEREIVVAESTVDLDRVLDLAQSPLVTPIRVAESEMVVGACGVANEGKGVDLWLQMVKRLACAPDLPATRFVWVGARASEARALAREMGLAGIVDFCGELENPYPWIRRMDVFTLPSRADAYPLVVLEALALGRPVVAFDVGGVADQLGDAGVLVPPQDVVTLSERVAELLKEPARRQLLGSAAQQRARQRLDLQHFESTVSRLVNENVA
jgi:glycosyltransferase involved in cell wall biosynthesis